MSFAVSADAYDRFMGRYSAMLSPQMADLAGVRAGQRVLDVGCGPGALTAELVERLGPEAVAAVDPSEPFVAAARERHPDVDVQQAAAERLPFADDAFDAALAQLVVHFMADPAAGLAEMRRVTRPDGVVVACVWDHGGGQGPLSAFWEVARSSTPTSTTSPTSRAPRGRPHAPVRGGGAARRRGDGALRQPRAPQLRGLVGAVHGRRRPGRRLHRRPRRRAATRLRERCREALPDAPFVLTARAWTARGLA